MLTKNVHVVRPVGEVSSEDHTDQTGAIGRSGAGVHVVLSPPLADTVARVMWRYAAAIGHQQITDDEVDVALLDALGIELHTAAQDIPAAPQGIVDVPLIGRTADR